MEGQVPNYQYLLRLASYNFQTKYKATSTTKHVLHSSRSHTSHVATPCTDMVISINSQGRLLALNPIPPFNSCVILEAYFPYLQNGGINSYFTGFLIRIKKDITYGTWQALNNVLKYNKLKITKQI